MRQKIDDITKGIINPDPYGRLIQGGSKMAEIIKEMERINNMRDNGEITENEATKLKLILMGGNKEDAKPKELIVEISEDEALGIKELEGSCSS